MKKFLIVILCFITFSIVAQDESLNTNQSNISPSENYNYDELISKGFDFYEDEEYELAVKYFSRAIEKNSDNYLAFYYRGCAFRQGLQFFEGTNITDNIMDLALKDQFQALELYTDGYGNLKGDIYLEIAVLKLLIDEGGWCNAFKKSCEYNNSEACDSFESLCK